MKQIIPFDIKDKFKITYFPNFLDDLIILNNPAHFTVVQNFRPLIMISIDLFTLVQIYLLNKMSSLLFIYNLYMIVVVIWFY